MSPRYLMLALAVLCGSALAQSNPSPSASPVLSAKVSDFAFFAGRWEGEVDHNKIEQLCSITDPAVLMCIFRMMDGKGTQMVEVYTLRDTAEGVIERVRFFSPDLQEDPGDRGITMRLASYAPDKMVFENPNGTYPKRSTLTRVGNDQMDSHIELVDGQGKASTIDAHWVRAK